jgi:hypothetical protein
VKVVQMMCPHVSKCKNDTCWNCSRKPGQGEEEQWREWIQVWYIWYIVRTCVNATMYHPEQQ